MHTSTCWDTRKKRAFPVYLLSFSVHRSAAEQLKCFLFLNSKKARLTSSGCWAPWCWHTCGRGNKCRGGCLLGSTPQASGFYTKTCGRCVWIHHPHCQNLSPTGNDPNMVFLISARCGANTLDHKPTQNTKMSVTEGQLLTYCRNTCRVLCFLGLTVASKRGRKMFSNILAKFGTNFFDLKMSLKNNNKDVRDHLDNSNLHINCEFGNII